MNLKTITMQDERGHESDPCNYFRPPTVLSIKRTQRPAVRPRGT